MSASHPSIDCDGSTGRQVIADPRDNPFPGCPYSAGVGDIVRTVGGLKSEWWAPSDQNGGRLQIGIGGRLTSEFAASERGSRCAGLLYGQWLDDQRDRDASDHGISCCYTRAWLSEDDIGIATKSNSIIRLTVCLAANFSKSTNSWFPIRFGLLASVRG